MWTGSTAPAGWALCDGSTYNRLAGGTIVSPDLRERFIVGTGGSYTINQTGGENSIALSRSQMPSHQHEASSNGANIAISSSGYHEHEYDYIPRNGKGYVGAYNSSNEVLGYGSWAQDATEGGGYHTHPNSNFSGSTGLGSGLSGSSVGSAHENRPPYYALAYIMKL
jgi:microcystin-dependent protein